MNYIGLKFIMLDMAFVQIVTTEKEAIDIMQGFTNKKLPPIIGGSSQYGSWVVKVENVQAIHTVPLQQGAQSDQSPYKGITGPGRSGIS